MTPTPARDGSPEGLWPFGGEFEGAQPSRSLFLADLLPLVCRTLLCLRAG